MAQRRMFSKSITNSSKFLMMSQSAQTLYFHFGMNADDDGFCEHFTVMRMTDSKPDDIKILQAKGFIHVFDDKVLIIRDWKENNYIRVDRYTASKYLNQYKDEIHNLLPSNGIPLVDQVVDTRYPQDRIGKGSIDKDSIDKGDAPAPKVEKKILHKDFVKLTEYELKKLTDKFGDKTTNEIIEKLNNYIGSKGKRYKSHYFTILNWLSKDGVRADLTVDEKIQADKDFIEKKLGYKKTKFIKSK